jgi:hypothetical protein
LTVSIRNVLNHPQLIPALGQAGRALAEERFDEKHILAQIMQLYTEAHE